jgi:hypothetical protein
MIVSKPLDTTLAGEKRIGGLDDLSFDPCALVDTATNARAIVGPPNRRRVTIAVLPKLDASIGLVVGGPRDASTRVRTGDEVADVVILPGRRAAVGVVDLHHPTEGVVGLPMLVSRVVD